jgi:hypothetical protein
MQCSPRPAIVLTTISEPTAAVRMLASSGMRVIVIGDEKTPPFDLEGCRYYSIRDQLAAGLLTAQALPRNHYCRKNVGYLIAMQFRASLILESDDDNLPEMEFFAVRSRQAECACLRDAGWVNVYRYFTGAAIWPRGFPLRLVRNLPPALDGLECVWVDAPIQQGLVNDDPDVDAVYRLANGSSCQFDSGGRVALGSGSWCPFNSQNTAWWPEAFCLMYLPSLCSFRMTDIWRSFVAQRIAWENGWYILFHGPTMRQNRNHHDLMRDFADEIPGYLHNERICERLSALPVVKGREHIPDNMRSCYAALTEMDLLPQLEMTLLEAWLADFQQCSVPGAPDFPHA